MIRTDTVGDRIGFAENVPFETVSMFLLGPTEHMVDMCAQEIRNTPEWAALFGCTPDDLGSIDTYKRMDYDVRQLPALRIYNESANKEFDSWFIVGDLVLDLIFPASLRRQDTQRIPDTISAAMLQQFRREPFFNAVSANVPGLNELGKTFNVDKSMGFEWGDNILPLTQIRANFRIDLRAWDDYLESVGRTKEDPFNFTLKELKRIVTYIETIKSDPTDVEQTFDLTVSTDQAIIEATQEGD